MAAAGIVVQDYVEGTYLGFGHLVPKRESTDGDLKPCCSIVRIGVVR